MGSSYPVRAVERLARILFEELWAAGYGGASRFKRALVLAGRVAVITVEGFVGDLCPLRASALAFASLLGLVPVLAVGFAVLRGLGWSGERLEALILGRATVLSPEAIRTIVSYIDRTNFAGLGVIGGSLLLVAVVSLLTNVETSFNAIWGGIPARPLVRRVSNYLGVLVVAPVLLAVATSLTAALESSAAIAWLSRLSGIGPAVDYVLKWTAIAVVWLLFAFLYVVIPNTKVKLHAALVGGIVAGSVWQLTQWAYIRFQIGVANYNAIYGALAQLPLLMAWFYASWMIVLFGAEITFAVENVGSLSHERRASRARGAALYEQAGLAIGQRLALTAAGMQPAPTIEELAFGLDVPIRTVREIVAALGSAGLVHISGENPPRCYLSRAPQCVSLAEFLGVLRGENGGIRAGLDQGAVGRLLGEMQAARDRALEGRSLADLAAGESPAH
ncbi:MAG: YihY/virulence factor BrkB family protein [Candidatus Dadabacteria bacterium]|nr:MAG: YihY/virulence factor BrkB family protein [Candidatus Dadabacteria bacterium]